MIQIRINPYSKQLSSLTKVDHCSTNLSLGSTRNAPTLLESHYVEGPRNLNADTFSRLLHSYMSSPLVGKKAGNVVSNSESNNRNELSYSQLMDDKDIIVVCLFVCLFVCLLLSKIPGWRMTPRSVTSEMCALQQKTPKIWLVPRNTSMKLYPSLCMP